MRIRQIDIDKFMEKCRKLGVGDSEVIDKVPEYIERGQKLVYPQRKAEWYALVQRNIFIDLKNSSTKFENALLIMEALDKGATPKEALLLIDNSIENERFRAITGLVTNFSKRGVEFGKYLLSQKFVFEADFNISYFQRLEIRNKKYELELEKDEIELEE